MGTHQAGRGVKMGGRSCHWEPLDALVERQALALSDKQANTGLERGTDFCSSSMQGKCSGAE